MKKAIITVSFGTSYPETREKTIGAVETVIAKRFSEATVFRAFTSNKVIKKIKEKEQVTIPTVDQLMVKLKEQGFQEVYLQPLHIIAGSEYHKAVRQALKHQHLFEKVKVGVPLLDSMDDYLETAAWLKSLTAEFRKEEALVLMGHGSQHTAFASYACLDHLLLNDPIYICAVESYPSLELLITRLQNHSYKTIHLYPLMLVAGDHATNDMASDEPNSWKSQLQDAGFQVKPVLKGMGEFNEIQERFAAHAAVMMGEKSDD